MCMPQMPNLMSNPLALMSPVTALLPNNPVTDFANKTITHAVAPVTSFVKHNPKTTAIAAVGPLTTQAFGSSGLQIPQG
jgi:inosine-uridine nucleoside N-ribohydrolase